MALDLRQLGGDHNIQGDFARSTGPLSKGRVHEVVELVEDLRSALGLLCGSWTLPRRIMVDHDIEA